ncbi:MAG: DoxX family protein [Rhodospirillales bacterium]|nr:DoxX family protein [Rhodospirillales bacterium]
MSFITHLAPEITARVLLVCMFPLSGLDKIFHWNEAMAQAKTSPVPAPALLLVLAMITEFLAPVCIVLGWHDRLAAFILCDYCILTAVLYHPFWAFPNFWTKPGEGRAHFWDFFKNLCLAGGLLLLVLSGGYTQLGGIVTHPLSNAPYSAHG